MGSSIINFIRNWLGGPVQSNTANINIGVHVEQNGKKVEAEENKPLSVEESSGGIDKADIGLINYYFKDKVKIHKQVFRLPIIKVVGECDLDGYQDEVEKERGALKKKGRPNDMHVILDGEPDWDGDPIDMQVRCVDYAGLTVLRNKGRRPKVITANVLIICSESEEVLLHKRSENVDTEKGRLHFFGGGYMPGVTYNGEASRADDYGSLKRTAEREFQEAFSTRITISDDIPMLLVEDNSHPEMPFIQLNYLVRDISKSELDEGIRHFKEKIESPAADNYWWEGAPKSYRITDLLTELKSDGADLKFALSGKAHLLVWLALACPGIKDKEKWGVVNKVRGALDMFKEITDPKKK